MTSALVDEVDPYVLPMPTPDSPVVMDRWISAGNRHPNGRYADAVWPLAPLIDNPGATLSKIHWSRCPIGLRGQLKLPAWIMINGELRPTVVQTRGHRARTRGSADDILETCREWIRLAHWAHERGMSDLGAFTDEWWSAYTTERWQSGITRAYSEKVLARLTDLWAYDQLAAHPSGIPRPPWDTEGVDDYLPSATGEGGRENTTEPLDPQVIGPLLVWAGRMVDDLAEDILAAWTERRRLLSIASASTATPAGRARIEETLLPLITSGAPIPSTGCDGGHTLARAFIAATTGASLGQVDRFKKQHGLTNLAAYRPGPCPLDVPVTGQVAGRPWRQSLDFNEAADLMKHLGTAAMIIILYLTGMRPQEAQGLRSGCCPDPAPRPDGTPGRHLIRSHHYKEVTNDNGHHISAGVEREVPWVAIAPVVRSIRILERIVPEGELLFSAAHHDFQGVKAHQGALKNGTLNRRIGSFVAWANREAVAQGLPEQAIPQDPHGELGMARFRRTLAWHIARRPGGLIALAIQYGHMRTVLDARTSTGYGALGRRGIHGVLDVETALAAADTAARLRDRMAAGEKISGPAARRAVTGATQAPHFEGRIVPSTFARKAAAYLARDGIVLFDNSDALLICAFKRETALCEPAANATSPNVVDCRAGCGNMARTDTHASQLRDRADEIDQLAAHAPMHIGNRLQAHAARLRQAAVTHAATAETAEVLR
ncbi:integrase [Streptomyces afghaniensis]|uniref:integrase n=1 Tax=Streptomyces afghaniensis TaxID=66865 RepID=UPI0037D097A9